MTYRNGNIAELDSNLSGVGLDDVWNIIKNEWDESNSSGAVGDFNVKEDGGVAKDQAMGLVVDLLVDEQERERLHCVASETIGIYAEVELLREFGIVRCIGKGTIGLFSGDRMDDNGFADFSRDTHECGLA